MEEQKRDNHTLQQQQHLNISQQTSQHYSETSSLITESKITLNNGEEFPVLTYNQYLSQASGGIGRIQVMAFILVFITKLSAYLLTNNVGFLELTPQFLCVDSDTSETYTCTTDEFCGAEEEYQEEIDWTSSYTIQNFITKFDLYCKVSAYTLMIGLSLKIGAFLYLIFFSYLFDSLGRKKVFNAALIIQMLSLLFIMFSPNYALVLYIALCIQAIAVSFLQIHGWIYLIEFVPRRYHSIFIVVSHLGRALGIVLGALYFWFVAKRVSWFFFINIVLSLIVIILVMSLFSESPKFFHMLKKYKRSRRILMEISMRQIGSPLKAIFREEAHDETLAINESYFEKLSLEEQYETAIESRDTEGIFSKKNFWAAMRENRGFRINTIVIILCHVASSFIMDLVVYMLPNLQGDIYWNALAVGLFEMFAYGMSGILIRILGLRLQILVCYILPFLISLIYVCLSETNDYTLAFSIGIVMFGVASNNNSTIYAAYSCTPKQLVTTFFVFQNYVKFSLLFLVPVIAEYNSKSIFYFILVISLVSAILSFFIKVKKHKEDQA